MMDYKEQFIKTLGTPKSELALDEYINFVISTERLNQSTHTEKHHILPRCLFDCEDVFVLSYQDHIKAHKLLAEAYPIRKFLRPLQFMLPRSETDGVHFKKMMSEAKKESWRKFKLSPEYTLWKENKSNSMREYLKYSEVRKKQIADTTRLRFSNKEERIKVSELFKALWKDELYRSRWILRKKDYYTDEKRKLVSNTSTEFWKSRSEEYRKSFREKMDIINKDLSKRQDASVKIKGLWEKEDFKKKMKSRKPRGSDGSKMKAKWEDPVWREMVINKRKQAREAKKNETNKG